MKKNDFTPSFNRSDSFGKPKPKPISVSCYDSTSKTKQKPRISTDDKENLFLSIASKSIQDQTPIFINTSTTIEDRQTELLEKIRTLDEENQSLRDIMKRNNYHYIQKQGIQKTKSPATPSPRNSSNQISIEFAKSTSLSFEQEQIPEDTPQKICQSFHTQRKNSQKQIKPVNVAVQKIQSQRKADDLAKQYASEFIIDQDAFDFKLKNVPTETLELSREDCIYRFSSEKYKQLLLEIIKKDTAIFESMDQTIQRELNQNFKENLETQRNHSNSLQYLLRFMEALVDSLEGNIPDKQFIIQSFNELVNLCNKTQKIITQYKLLFIPLSNITLEENSNNYDELKLTLYQANIQIEQATKTIQVLSKQNKDLTDLNQQLITSVYSLIKYKNEDSKFLQITSELQNLIQKGNSVMNLIPIETYGEVNDRLYKHGIINLLLMPKENPLEYSIEQLQRKFETLHQKYSKNKLKFKNLLITISNLIQCNIDRGALLNVNQLHQQITSKLKQDYQQ